LQSTALKSVPLNPTQACCPQDQAKILHQNYAVQEGH
jgi:hypothetical protein